MLQSQYDLSGRLTHVKYRVVGYVDGPCGSRKTTAMREHVMKLERMGTDIRPTIVQPTVLLADDTAKRIRRAYDGCKREVPLDVFHHETVAGLPVSQAITESTMRPTDERGRITIMTHASLAEAYFHDKHLRTFMIDEALEVVRHAELASPDQLVLPDLIPSLFKFGEQRGGYLRVEARDATEMARVARGEHLELMYQGESVREVAKLLTCPWRQVWVCIKSLKKALARKRDHVEFHAVLDPAILDGCRSTCVFAANFTHTLMYLVWSRMGNVEFVCHETLTNELHFRRHACGLRVTIHCLPIKKWSRYLRETVGPDGRTNQEVFRDAAKRATRNCKSVIWIGNKYLHGRKLPDDYVDGRRIPHVPHGLNDYADADAVIFMSSLLPTSEQFEFFWHVCGVKSEEVTRAIYCDAVYQAVMRSSLRDPDALGAVDVVVPDLGAARYLAQLMPGASVVEMETKLTMTRARPKKERKKPGRKKVYANTAEKQAAYRERKAREKRAMKKEGAMSFGTTSYKTQCRETRQATGRG